jgi:hypothetical protein
MTMSKRYVLKPGLQSASIPGTGRVSAGVVLEGDQYARYAGSILVEILDSVPTAAPRPVLTEPAPVPKVESTPKATTADLLVEAPKEEKKEEKKEEPKRSAWGRRRKKKEEKKEE